MSSVPGPAPPWRNDLRAALTRSRVRFDVPLKPFTTLRVGGAADALVELESDDELARLFEVIARHDLPWTVLGKGSNLLVPDAGVRGVVLRLGRAYATVTPGAAIHTLHAGAAVPNAQFVERCRRDGLGGLEFLIAIPGSIGGAVAMNAGAHQGETADALVSVCYFQWGLGIATAPAGDFAFAYRSSQLRAPLGRIVLSAVFRLQPVDESTSRARITQFQTYRRETQPRDFPNCGSVFKNPAGDFAARLIERAGLKGRMLGGAQVSEKHANFIVNRGNATAADILELIALIRETLLRETGVTLELELQQLVGTRLAGSSGSHIVPGAVSAP
ncbi:MAG: UDP-N-acetylmuramate dehydrogenase [Candidatus Lambdaproteobacteria bacterium]|nr:UDP-N-acetylmuramate dehydrogenase [Candidatus Lambdaproteobacteria bacterium]